MAYTRLDYADVEPRADGMHFLRDALDCENLGLTVVDVDAGWNGMEHDHADEGHEEVHLVVSGEATLTVDGEELSLSEGDAVRVAPGATRSLQAETDLVDVVVGAP
jgi:quercetin dioxygenase-like cupin family protein